MKQKPRTWDWEKILEYGHFKKTDKVLETGALFGEFAMTLSPLVESVIVTDSYDWADRRFVHEGDQDLVQVWEDNIRTRDNLKIEKADMQHLKYPEHSFDKVVCISSIEHVPNDIESIKEMMRVLKPGGLLLLTTEYHPENEQMVVDKDKSFYRVYNGKGINKLTEGFEVAAMEILSVNPVGFTTIFLSLRNGK